VVSEFLDPTRHRSPPVDLSPDSGGLEDLPQELVQGRVWQGSARLSPSPFRCAGSPRVTASVSRPPPQRAVYGHPTNFDKSAASKPLVGNYCRVPYWTGNSGSKPPSLAIQTAIAPEKGRFALENWAARKAAIHDASRSPGSGGVRQAGRAQPVPPGVSWPAWLLCLAGRLAEALTPRSGPGGRVPRLTSTSNSNFPALCVDGGENPRKSGEY
jgi:hypothetical protein